MTAQSWAAESDTAVSAPEGAGCRASTRRSASVGSIERASLRRCIGPTMPSGQELHAPIEMRQRLDGAILRCAGSHFGQHALLDSLFEAARRPAGNAVAGGAVHLLRLRAERR